MKANLIELFIPLVLVWSVLLLNIEAQRDIDACSIFPDGTKLRHPDDCSQQIICKNFKSSPGLKCSGAKPFYNKDTYKCETNLIDDSTCAIDCTWWAGEFVADPKSCYGYYYCQDEVLAIAGYCQPKYHFNQTLQACIDAPVSDCDRSKLNYCAIVATGVKFKDENYCGRYYECVLDKKTGKVELTNSYCPATALNFNAAKGVCEKEPASVCKPVPKNVCIVRKKIKKNYFVSDGATCQGSFFCRDVGKEADTNPTFHQCPDNKFFSEEHQKCLDPKEVVCTKDRCQGSTRTFVTSDQKGCRHYLRCENGRKVGEATCGNLFFDEEKGVCTPKLVTYPACYHA